MLKKFVAGLCVTAAVMFGAATVHAVPSLGVGTGEFDCTGATEYWECFSGNLGGHAFALPESGGTVTPFTNITDYDIWLLAEPSIGTFTFDGTTSSVVSVGGKGTFGSYDAPYQGVNLGLAADWDEITSDLFNPGTFYMLEGTLTYTGDDIAGDWMFLVADVGDNGLMPTGAGHDPFSPKTTSAVGNGGGGQVPEPATLLLLGAGLLGLPLLKRKQ